MATNLNSLEMASLGLLGPGGRNSLTMAAIGLLSAGVVVLEQPLQPGGGGPRRRPLVPVSDARLLRDDEELLAIIADLVTKGYLD